MFTKQSTWSSTIIILSVIQHDYQITYMLNTWSSDRCDHRDGGGSRDGGSRESRSLKIVLITFPLLGGAIGLSLQPTALTGCLDPPEPLAAPLLLGSSLPPPCLLASLIFLFLCSQHTAAAKPATYESEGEGEGEYQIRISESSVFINFVITSWTFICHIFQSNRRTHSNYMRLPISE